MIATEYIGGKYCKKCGLYHSEEWHKLDNGDYLCKNCYEDYIVDFYANLELHKRNHRKFPLVVQLVRALA